MKREESTLVSGRDESAIGGGGQLVLLLPGPSPELSVGGPEWLEALISTLGIVELKRHLVPRPLG